MTFLSVLSPAFIVSPTPLIRVPLPRSTSFSPSHPTLSSTHFAITPCRAVATNIPSTLPQSPSQVPPLSPLFDSKSFASLGLSPQLSTALASQSITHPTGIQSRAIPAILGHIDVILGAATGSGKTLAYLLPVIQMLKDAEQLRDVNGPPLRIARRPRALVIVPTRELGEQVVCVAKVLAHHAKIRAVGLMGGNGAGTRRTRELLEAPIDILVTTTGRLTQLLQQRVVDVRFVQHLVVDEVDTMFDAGFGPELRRILQMCRRGRDEENEIKNPMQCILVGATHPKAAEEVYREEFAEAKRVNVDLHRVPPGLMQRFIHVEGNEKTRELLTFLGDVGREGGLKGGKMMVFCNTVDSCRFLDHFLVESGYSTACVHGEIPAERRKVEYGMFKRGERELLVCTDMAARGLDNLKVEHVVLFDFPTSAVDYIHRAGRTARAGATGRVTSFVTKRDLRLARAVERAGLGMLDALESARVAREEEAERRKREEEAARENAKRMTEMVERGREDVSFGKVGAERGKKRRDAMQRSERGGRGGGGRGRGRGAGSGRGRGAGRGRGRGAGRGNGRR